MTVRAFVARPQLRNERISYMTVTADDITFVARLVQELCGVVLDDTKAYLIESRLSELVKTAGAASYTDLCLRARSTNDQALRAKIIDAITTQETLFFRDNSPFDALQFKVLPELIDSKAKTPTPKRLRIWSAASSTGQEAYSIAITLAEMIPDVFSWDVAIHASDISDAAIATASRGWYANHEIQRGMKPQLLAKYFTQQNGGWKINDRIRALVAFHKRNLLQPLVGIGPYDVIFCRNVAIYFEPAARRDLFLRLADQLTPNGYLFVGSSESLMDLGPRFMPRNHCRGTYYQPNQLPGQPSAAPVRANPLPAAPGPVNGTPVPNRPNNFAMPPRAGAIPTPGRAPVLSK
jgi:chemotaxis protein methyltransferase CheR